MNNLTEQVKHGAEQALASLSQGWRELKDRASGALTRFQPSAEKGSEGSNGDLPSLSSWAFMAADVADANDSIIVRLEAPGMTRSDFKIELRGETLFKARSGSSASSRATAIARYRAPTAPSGVRLRSLRR